MLKRAFLLLVNIMIIGSTWTHAHAILAGFQTDRDFSKLSARTSRDWVRDGVVYEIFTRNFSAAGNFDGITRRLDELQNLGVTILWLMPILPMGNLNKKGSIGSP